MSLIKVYFKCIIVLLILNLALSVGADPSVDIIFSPIGWEEGTALTEIYELLRSKISIDIEPKSTDEYLVRVYFKAMEINSEQSFNLKSQDDEFLLSIYGLNDIQINKSDDGLIFSKLVLNETKSIETVTLLILPSSLNLEKLSLKRNRSSTIFNYKTDDTGDVVVSPIYGMFLANYGDLEVGKLLGKEGPQQSAMDIENDIFGLVLAGYFTIRDGIESDFSPGMTIGRVMKATRISMTYVYNRANHCFVLPLILDN